jgi:hypothetical protein
MTVHLLKSVEGGKRYTARCGHVEDLKKAGPMPAEFVGWFSKVTCEACKRDALRPQLRVEPPATLL